MSIAGVSEVLKSSLGRVFGDDPNRFKMIQHETLIQLEEILKKMHLDNMDVYRLLARSSMPLEGVVQISPANPSEVMILLFSSYDTQRGKKRLLFYRADFSEGVDDAQLLHEELEVNVNLSPYQCPFPLAVSMSPVNLNKAYGVSLLNKALELSSP